MAALAAVIFAQGQGNQLLANYNKALSDAKSLSTNYKIIPVGGTPSEVTVELAKPNMAKIDTSSELIVADGTTITTYNKAEKAYFKKPQTDADLKALFKSDDLGLWAGFFNSKAISTTGTAKSLGTKNRKGMTLNVVEAWADAKGRKTVTFYLNSQDGVVRQAEIAINDQGVKDTTVIDTKTLTLGGDASKDLFAFKAPEGSKEVSWEEMNSAKWFYNLDEAKAFAAKTGKKIFVDFMATWCGPCKLLDRDVFQKEDWKKMSKYVVFCKIDVDQQPSVMQAYNVEAMPTQMVLTADGAVLATKVGYANPSDFYSFLNGALGI
ncbi:MAG: thioredoxin family protein [Chlorobia bacterium]|nr:thioredoxin family protein [Fimbriimonadaceae bacterium]